MSIEAKPVARHIDLPVMAGSKLALWVPLASELIGPKPLELGHGFTVDLNGDRWRAVVETLSAKRKGTLIELKIEGRYREDRERVSDGAPCIRCGSADVEVRDAAEFGGIAGVMLNHCNRCQAEWGGQWPWPTPR